MGGVFNEGMMPISTFSGRAAFSVLALKLIPPCVSLALFKLLSPSLEPRISEFVSEQVHTQDL